MKLLVNRTTGQIYAASDVAGWQVPDFAHVIDWPGNADSTVWPGGGPTFAQVSGESLTRNPAALATARALTVDDLASALKTKGVLIDSDIKKG